MGTTTTAALQIIRIEHTALAAVLRSLLLLLDRGPEQEPERFFDVARAMLFYIDEFPERLHHPKETTLLHPRLLERAPQLAPTLQRLDADHARGEAAVRELQHLLLAWELLGESRRAAFEAEARRYASFYLEHMRLEEAVVLPQAEKALTAQDWRQLDEAFATNLDPLANPQQKEHRQQYERLLTRIVLRAPAPIGLG